MKFQTEWDEKAYVSFLGENGFAVKKEKLLPSTIPLVYAECVPADRS